MNSRMVLRLATVAALAAGGAMVSAQGQLLPSSPKLGFGASVTPAYDGWYDNPDGTKTFLIGYYNRNWTQEVDIPVGPNNRFEPGDPDRGQPTHFLPNRNFGMFTVSVPEELPGNEHLWWTVTLNGVTSRVGMILSPDYNITPQKASEEAPNGKYNMPPVLRFAEGGPAIQNPVGDHCPRHREDGHRRRADAAGPVRRRRCALCQRHERADDRTDSACRRSDRREVPRPRLGEGEGLPRSRRSRAASQWNPTPARPSGTVSFSDPGDYVVHVTINDFSDKGGGATGCCWTTCDGQGQRQAGLRAHDWRHGRKSAVTVAVDTRRASLTGGPTARLLLRSPLPFAITRLLSTRVA